MPSSQPWFWLPTVAPGSSPVGYLPLSVFGVSPTAGFGDESLINFNVPSFVFAGETWSSVGVSSNGFLVVGGGSPAQNPSTGTTLPNPAAPNNILAPFWTNLDPSLGGGILLSTLTDGVDTWLVVEWDDVPFRTDPTGP